MSLRPDPAPVVCESAAAVGALAAELLRNRLSARGTVRVLLPTGHTPAPLYAALRERGRSDPEALAGATVLQLDEYLGLGPGDPRSFAASLRRELAGTGIDALETLDGAAADPHAEAARHQARIEAAPVDLAILGLGVNGHVAFDEPFARLERGVSVVDLASATRTAAAADFAPDPVPARGITTGIGTLMDCRELLLLVTGAHKAEALRAVLTGAPGPASPGSLLRLHPRLTVLCDPPAADRLRDLPLSDHVVIVLGHRDLGVSAEHRISIESLQRVQRAERLLRRDPARAVIFTGFTATGGLSEAEQMARHWNAAETPSLLEVAGRETAENASRSYPLLVAMGGVRRVTVVTSAWHVRAAYFFRPLADRGLRVRLAREWTGSGWGRYARRELRMLRFARRERARAWSEPLPGPQRALHAPGAADEHELRRRADRERGGQADGRRRARTRRR